MELKTIIELHNGNRIPLPETPQEFMVRYNNKIIEQGKDCLIEIGNRNERMDNVSCVRPITPEEEKEYSGTKQMDAIRKETGLDELNIDQIDDE